MKLIERKIQILPNEFFVFKFEWDDKKSELNKLKHSLSFEDALSLFEENYHSTLQSFAKIRDGEKRLQIELLDKNNKKWKMVFVVVNKTENSESECLIRIITFHRK